MSGTKSGIGKIRASLNGLSPKLRSIAEHIIKHPQDAVHKSITELAEVTSSSEATIVVLALRNQFGGHAVVKND
ncbi:RpiR family transcriptional regulator [Bacillus pseudomycoides]|nr:RpiR family transcriptional regulator [Bacillus pseudomycoides]PEM65967.1 RpiR family transcriptional regulator [Bacillus pseudomycoides]PHC84958.1 RpiR family transcriptional regulator [Bacillus pseudomycoides]